MPKVKLTDAAVQRFKAPPGGRVEYFDATLPGFGVRVAGPTARSPEGRKSWVLFYRFGGEQRRLTIEPGYPALGLADARKRAGDALALVSKGTDPAAEKVATKAANARRPDTVGNIVEDFIKRHLEGKRRAPRYIEETRRNFDNHVLPRWRDRDIGSITRRDVIDLLDAIVDSGTMVKQEDGTTKHIKGGPICANRVLAAVRALLNWALRRGVIETTPAALVERPGEETRRERTLSADELRVIWPAMEAMAYPLGPFFRMVLLTGCRREEVATMAWADVDLEEKVWTIPAEVTKAGRGHAVPLSPAAMALLKSLPRKMTKAANGGLVPSPHVFTTYGSAPISGYSVAKKAIDAKVAKVRAEAELAEIAAWTVHDLRRTAATEMARLGVSRFTISRVLNHSDRSVTGIYDRHSYLAEKRHALETWASYLTGLMGPAKDNVVALRA
jgi:integrase